MAGLLLLEHAVFLLFGVLLFAFGERYPCTVTYLPAHLLLPGSLPLCTAQEAGIRADVRGPCSSPPEALAPFGEHACWGERWPSFGQLGAGVRAIQGCDLLHLRGVIASATCKVGETVWGA